MMMNAEGVNVVSLIFIGSYRIEPLVYNCKPFIYKKVKLYTAIIILINIYLGSAFFIGLFITTGRRL